MNAEITDTPENPLDSAIVRNGEADFSESYGKGFYVVSGKADGWYLAVTADGQFQFYFEKTENGDFPLPDDFERTRERPGRTLGQLIEDVQLAQEMRSWKFAPETKEPSVIPR